MFSKAKSREEYESLSLVKLVDMSTMSLVYYLEKNGWQERHCRPPSQKIERNKSEDLDGYPEQC